MGLRGSTMQKTSAKPADDVDGAVRCHCLQRLITYGITTSVGSDASLLLNHQLPARLLSVRTSIAS